MYLIHPLLRWWLTVGVDKSDELPQEFYLSQNYPNPFNPSTAIKYGLPKASHVKLEIFDNNGRKVTELVNNNQDPGTYQVFWNGSNDLGQSVASGVYLYQLRCGEYLSTRKMMLIK
jgi:hypothetical protein